MKSLTLDDTTTCMEASGKPVRLANFCRCGARIFAGFHDFRGHWKPRYYATPRADAPALEDCPICTNPLTGVLTAFQMEALQMAARERMCHGGALDEAAVGALAAELEVGATFEDVADLYGRTPEKLRAELAAWLTAAESIAA